MYKRQDVIRADRRNADNLTTELLHKGEILGFGVADDDVILRDEEGAVSYTHLDVYKRQEQAGAVDADNPVRLRTAECCFLETVIFLAVPEMIEAFADGGVLQRADPQTLEGLGARCV